MVPLVVVGLNSELFRGFFQVQLVGLGDDLKGLDEVDDDVSPQDAACSGKNDILRQPDFQYEAAEGAERSRLRQCIRGAKIQVTLKRGFFGLNKSHLNVAWLQHQNQPTYCQVLPLQNSHSHLGPKFSIWLNKFSMTKVLSHVDR